MSLGSECFHQHPAVVQMQTMTNRNHNERNVGKGNASFALSPQSVTKQGVTDSSGLSGMLWPPRPRKGCFVPRPLPGSRSPVPVPVFSAAGGLQTPVRWLPGAPSSTQLPSPCPSASSRTQPELFPVRNSLWPWQDGSYCHHQPLERVRSQLSAGLPAPTREVG